MAQTKTEFKFFTVFQYKAEQEYLREMHIAGWKLTGITFPGFYHFEESSFEDVVYQLDYNLGGTAQKNAYIQIFSDCGWEYMFDFAGYSYFRKPVSQMEGAEEIFCDDESRLEMMKRVFKGRVTPLICVFFGIILPQLFLQSSYFAGHTANQGLTIFFLIAFVLYLALFIAFGIQFFSYERRVREPDISSKIKYGILSFATLVMCVFVILGVTRLWAPKDSKYTLNTLPNQYSIGAVYLNETIKHEMKLKTGDELEVNIVLLKGDIHLSIYLDDNEPVYEGTVTKQAFFTLPIHENGTYTIATTGEEAEGSFCFQIK